MVIVVAVMPGADAVSAALELPPEAAPEPEPEEHAATASAATVTMAMAGTRSRWDLFIECLLSRGGPGGCPPGLSEPRAGWPAPCWPETCHPAWMPCADRKSIALRPGFPAGR